MNDAYACVLLKREKDSIRDGGRRGCAEDLFFARRFLEREDKLVSDKKAEGTTRSARLPGQRQTFLKIRIKSTEFKAG